MGLKESITRVTRNGAGWLLVAALFYSPWDEGGTSAEAIRHLDWLLGVMFLLWGLGALYAKISRRRAEIRGGEFHSGILQLIALLLLLLGWGMALNAHAVFDADYSVFLPLTSLMPGAPGSVDYFLSVALMWRVTTLLGCIWVMAQLAQDEKWLLRIWWAIGLAGGSIALLGLVQKATGAELPFWQSLERGEPAVSTFFASFYYHGNAGAYLNLALPAVLGLAFRYVTRPSNPVARALWLTMSVIMIVAVASDTSRMGQALAALMTLTLLVLWAKKGFRKVRHLEVRTALVALVVGGVALWAIVQTSHLDRSLGRWDSVRSTWTKDARWLVDRIAIKGLPEAGATGFGPGTFSVVFPTLQRGAEPGAQGSWLFLHNDYLQTLLEWGWIGGVLWAGLFFGGMLVALRSLAKEGRSWYPRQRLFLPVTLVALAGVAIHAAVDFPLQISSIQLSVATYLGICWGSRGWGKRKS
ncbi:MAG: hypothetical protein ABI883_05105 [Chthoniobacterales bacterium]